MRQVQEISLNFSTATSQASQAFSDLTRLVSGERLLDRSRLLFPQLAIRELPETGLTLTVDGEQQIAFPSGKVHSARKLIELSELVSRFEDHIVRVDHMGINLPAENIRGRELLNLLSQDAHVYEYPTGDPWYFVIPATMDELNHDITDFSKIRFPKFEIVLEGSDAKPPLIQIDCATDLTREKVEERLPAPYGVSLPGLEQFFRSVFVAHPWGSFLLRMDFRYRDEAAVNEWSSCEWLVQAGKRYDNSGNRSA
jgi:hypothetical protein